MKKIIQTQNTKSAGGVVINKRGEDLVVNQWGKSWSLPKGHIDGGEDMVTAAKREIYEESGIKKLEFVKKLGSYKRYRAGDDKRELKHIFFLFKTNSTDLNPIDPHNPEARWVPKEKVFDLLTFEKDKEFFLKIKDKIQ